MTRPARRVADYAPSTLEFSAELVLAAAVEEAVALLRDGMKPVIEHVHYEGGSYSFTFRYRTPHEVETTRCNARNALLAAATTAELILDRSAS